LGWAMKYLNVDGSGFIAIAILNVMTDIQGLGLSDLELAAH